jgi:hypothetical protein
MRIQESSRENSKERKISRQREQRQRVETETKKERKKDRRDLRGTSCIIMTLSGGLLLGFRFASKGAD